MFEHSVTLIEDISIITPAMQGTNDLGKWYIQMGLTKLLQVTLDVYQSSQIPSGGGQGRLGFHPCINIAITGGATYQQTFSSSVAVQRFDFCLGRIS